MAENKRIPTVAEAALKGAVQGLASGGGISGAAISAAKTFGSFPKKFETSQKRLADAKLKDTKAAQEIVDKANKIQHKQDRLAEQTATKKEKEEKSQAILTKKVQEGQLRRELEKANPFMNKSGIDKLIQKEKYSQMTPAEKKTYNLSQGRKARMANIKQGRQEKLADEYYNMLQTKADFFGPDKKPKFTREALSKKGSKPYREMVNYYNTKGIK